MSKKITNTTIADAIKLYFCRLGKRVTNLQKATRPMLDGIIKKHNLNLDELLEELAKNNEMAKEGVEQQKREREEREIQTQKEMEKRRVADLDRWQTLSNEDKDKVYQFAYDEYVKNAIVENEISIKMTDQMEKKIRADGVTNIQRINQSTLCVRGVNIINGHLTEINSKEEYVKDFNKYEQYIFKINRDKNLQAFIIELFEAEMIRQGFTKEDDGEFYTTIFVKVKSKR